MSINKKSLYVCTLGILLMLLPAVLAISASIGNSKMVLRVGPGEEIEKYILVKNVNEVAVNISLEVTGELAENLKLEESNFRLGAKEDKKAIFTIRAGGNGTMKTKVNVGFVPDEGNSVGLSSEIILIVDEKYAGAGRITEEVEEKNDNIIDKISGMISLKNSDSGNGGDKIIVFAIISSFVLVCVLIGFYFYSLTKRAEKVIQKPGEKLKNE